MTAIELKNNFHNLIDSIDNENLLREFYELMLRKRTSNDGRLWAMLSADEITELLAANQESEDSENLIPHEEMKKQYSKWL